MALRRAVMRDDKLAKVASSRRKADQTYTTRAAYFQSAIRANNSLPLALPKIHELIKTYIHQHDDEYATLKAERRPGRPSSTREDALKAKIERDLKEYTVGFLLPDLGEADNVTFLDRWDGEMSYLSTLKWVRITQEGVITTTSFPPKG